ncbi:MAG: hypothetical protein HY897_07505 [Deltaproteobacteria bacterium]|nr:hypothetical protein [Deltaproteobacteria bacterium]
MVNGYLYAIGGYDGTKTLNDVLVAKINSDGTVGSWASTTPSPISNWWAAGGIYNGHVIVGGGWDGTNRISDVFAAPINANGTVGEWKGTASLPTAQNFHAGAYSNGFVYAIGGCTNVACSAMTDEVKFAPVNADGTVGTWNAGAALPTAKWSFAASAYNRYVYVIGGCTKSNCSNVLKEVHYAPVQGNGAITSWTPAPDFPKPIHAHNMMAYNDYLYVIGGISTSGPYLDDVYYSRINQDGSLGQWNTSQKFAIARGLHTSTLFAGNLYLIGGGDSAIGYKDDVQYAPINADGTVGAWNMSSTHLPNTLAGLASVAANGYLIATGGYNAGGYASGVWATPVKPAGDIGSFPTASSLLTQKAGHSSVFYSGYLYVIGGSNQTNAFADVQFAPVTAYSTSTKSTFSKQFDLGSVEVIHSIELKGVLGGVNSSFDLSYRIAGDDAVYGNWSAPVSLTSVPGAVVVGVVGRYIEVAVTINDNGRLGVTSGMGSSELSELSVSYGEEPDGGMTDGGDAATDGGVDAESDGGQDGGMSDAGSDTGQVTGDGGEDAGEPDSGVTDTGAQDAGDMDAAFDSGSDTSFDGAQDGSHPSDASDDGAADTGVPDDGAQDTGGMDAGTDASEKPAAEEEIPQNMYSCSCSTLALAQDTPWVEPAKEEKKQSMSVAVFQFEAQGADKKIPVILTDTVLSMLNRLPDTRVIGSKEIDAMLNYEQKKQMTGCNDASCAVALGGALGVDKILMGSVGRLGETHILDMKLIDIRTAHIDTSYNKRLESGREEEFLDVLPEALTVLFPWAEGTWAKTTSASQKPEAKSQKAEAKSQKAGVLAHAGMFGLSLRGYADLKFTGGAGDLSAGYFFADWFEASLGVGYGAHAMLKPRLTFLLYNLDGSVKPYLTAHGLAFFSDPVALGAGVGPGIQFEFDGHWGLFLETPIEYFFVSPEIADAWVVLVALGVQLRI